MDDDKVSHHSDDKVMIKFDNDDKFSHHSDAKDRHWMFDVLTCCPSFAGACTSGGYGGCG